MNQELRFQWVADVCYPPSLRRWQDFAWRDIDDQPDWRHLTFNEWHTIIEKYPEHCNREDDDELIIWRPSFQGWQTRILAFDTIEGECMCHDCKQPATTRIAWNCHGTCLESYVCDQHADRHGVWADSL